MAGYVAAVVRLVSGLAALALPLTPPLGQPAKTWGDRLGLKAFSLLKHRDQCVFFVVTALFSVPLSAFYMYGPEFLMALGGKRAAATMTVAQVLEVACMLVVGTMMARFRVKTMLSLALGLSALRYAMSAFSGVNGDIGWHIAGIALHGVCYPFYFITAQVFLDRRVDPGLRGQAQGLMAMVAGGLGPLAGAWFCGWLRGFCVSPGGGGWDLYWGILASMIALCFAVFIGFYRGVEKRAG
jgi:MFS family permease